MSLQKIKIINARAIVPQGIIENASLLIIGDKIAEIKAGKIDAADVNVIDAEGKYVSPGFIDIHIHGGGGSDFMDGTLDAFLTIADTHARYGTTSMFPTTLTAEKEDLLNTLDVYKEAVKQNKNGAQFLGMHIEGPYFAMEQRGAQDPRFIRNPEENEYKEIIAHAGNSIARWSAAPELEGALEFGRYIKSKGILPSIAHTDGRYEDVFNAFENGYTLATHFYSAMSTITRIDGFRYAGIVEGVYLVDDIDVEIIADGAHLPAPLLQLVCKIKGTDRVALITDAMRAAGMPEGESILGSKKNGMKVIVEDGVAKLPDRTAFAGSVATTDMLVRNMIKLAGLSIQDAIKMMTLVPARIMNINQQKGSLEIGKDADIVIFDEDINVEMTMVKGEIVCGL